MNPISLEKSACVTIGNFDGVHLGHQSLIALARQVAQSSNLQLITITFWPHPRDVIPGQGPHNPLTSRRDRELLLNQEGAGQIMEIAFTPELSAMTPQEFIEQYLRPIGLKYLIIGHDFSLGKSRQGNAANLAALADIYDFQLRQASPFAIDDEVVSSTRIRQLLSIGNVEQAATMLGRSHAIEGIVERGFQRGRGLGFPTANLRNPGQLLPGNGVYATYAEIVGERYEAVTNVGLNPTFHGKEVSVETFLLDTNKNIYDQHLRLEFISKIRNEQKFPSPKALAAQINQDVATARAIFS